MDKVRYGVGERKKKRRILILLVFVLVASAGTYALSKLKPAIPSIERTTLWLDRVKRGPLLRDIHGTGSLVPEDFRWVPSRQDGLVETIHKRIGDTVDANTVLAELSNPDLLQRFVDTELQIKAAEADLANTRASQQNTIINQQILIANLDAAANRASLQANTNDELFKQGLIGKLNVRLSRLDAENSSAQVEREKQRIEINAVSAEAQIAAQQARLDQLHAAHELKKRQIEELKIRAGVAGVLQEVSIEGGQRVTAGTTIAKIAEPGRLKAQLRIAETQAKDILLGQKASIDTRNGVISGIIVHIDPASVQGTVTIDVQLEGELPRGARPDLSIDGVVEIERLNNVLYVGRPSVAMTNSTVQMFKVSPTGEAIRTRVHIGRVSVNSIEILDGLQEGEEVILSDMSLWDASDRLRLN